MQIRPRCGCTRTGLMLHCSPRACPLPCGVLPGPGPGKLGRMVGPAVALRCTCSAAVCCGHGVRVAVRCTVGYTVRLAAKLDRCAVGGGEFSAHRLSAAFAYRPRDSVGCRTQSREVWCVVRGGATCRRRVRRISLFR